MSPNPDSPYHSELAGLLLKAFGPVQVLAEELAGIPDVARAYVFGSWARAYLGEEGPEPVDIDVVVIGSAPPRDAHAALRRAEARLERPVNATLLSEEEWDAAEGGFLRTIRRGPLVEVPVDG